MKIVFAGTPPFAAASLAALHAAGHQIELVLTQPDRAAGRGMKLKSSAVADKATLLKLTLAKPESLKIEAVQTTLRTLEPDAIVVAAYGLILPQAVLDIPKYGCINIHGSLLPRWRGAAPVQRAIEAGDAETGITIMKMNAGLDTGDVLRTHAIAIATDETSGSLFEKLSATAAAAIVEALEKLPVLDALAQPNEGITYAKKIEKVEARIDWSQPMAVIERRIRAFDPAPGCESTLEAEPIKIWRATLNAVRLDSTAAPGTVLEVTPDHVTVQCGDGALNLIIIQKPGGKRMMITEFLRGSNIQTGWRFL
jgi:methionyl-tRNA formyltransferase